MFSLQLHFPSESYMGRHPSVVQHIVSAAIASALSELGPGYAKVSRALRVANFLFLLENVPMPFYLLFRHLIFT